MHGNPDLRLPPTLPKPALRGLAGAGYERLEQLPEVTERELLRLHGVGPSAIDRLRQVLEENGMRFAPE